LDTCDIFIEITKLKIELVLFLSQGRLHRKHHKYRTELVAKKVKMSLRGTVSGSGTAARESWEESPFNFENNLDEPRSLKNRHEEKNNGNRKRALVDNGKNMTELENEESGTNDNIDSYGKPGDENLDTVGDESPSEVEEPVTSNSGNNNKEEANDENPAETVGDESPSELEESVQSNSGDNKDEQDNEEEPAEVVGDESPSEVEESVQSNSGDNNDEQDNEEEPAEVVGDESPSEVEESVQSNSGDNNDEEGNEEEPAEVVGDESPSEVEESVQSNSGDNNEEGNEEEPAEVVGDESPSEVEESVQSNSGVNNDEQDNEEEPAEAVGDENPSELEESVQSNLGDNNEEGNEEEPAEVVGDEFKTSMQSNTGSADVSHSGSGDNYFPQGSWDGEVAEQENLAMPSHNEEISGSDVDPAIPNNKENEVNGNDTDDNDEWLGSIMDDGNNLAGPIFFVSIFALLFFFWKRRSNSYAMQGGYRPVPMGGRSKLHAT